MIFKSFLYFAITSVVFVKVLAQTPKDFKPGTNVQLGVAFPGQSISPAGTLVMSLEEVMNAPNVKIPASALQQANNGSNSLVVDQAMTRFAVFMIDIDVIANGTATTLLHWFQSDLIPQGQVSAQAFGNTSRIQTLPSSPEAAPIRLGHPLVTREIAMSSVPSNQSSDSSSTQPRYEAPYLPPSPPPGIPHRYVLALFVQMANYSFPACYSDVASPMNATPPKNGTMITIDVKARLGFDVQEFAKVAGLIPIPVAGNFFRAGTDIGNAKKRNIWKKRADDTSVNDAQITSRSVSLKKVDCVATATPNSKESPVATTIFVTATATATQTTTVATQTVVVVESTNVKGTTKSSIKTESSKPTATGKGHA